MRWPIRQFTLNSFFCSVQHIILGINLVDALTWSTSNLIAASEPMEIDTGALSKRQVIREIKMPKWHKSVPPNGLNPSVRVSKTLGVHLG